jgi:hypothetical protein
MNAKVIRLRPEHDPRYQNRKGPGGIDLDPTEALSWFPLLVEAPSPVADIQAHDSVLVGYGSLRFWLHDVEPSVEPGVYFGNICDDLPDNDACLDSNQNIGFELRHVFEARSRVTP